MYYTAFRFVAAKKISEESKSLLVCVDADSLIMHSLQQAIADARQHDVGLYFRLKKRALHKKIAAFCVLVNHTQPALDVLSLCSGLVLKFHHRYPRLRSSPWIDQSGLYVAYLWSTLRGTVSFYTVDNCMVDYEFSARACIWTAKGKQKEEAVLLTASHRILEKYAAALPSQAQDSA
jgi:hypothetical protein